MRDLAGYRQFVWTHFDVDSTDVSTDLIDAWVAEGFRRVVRVAHRWPFYEATASLVTSSGIATYTVSDLEEIHSIEGPNGQLALMDATEAQNRYFTYGGTPLQGRPNVWSKWGTQIKLWPIPDAAYTLNVLGYRAPTDWIAAGSGAVPDFPADFEDVLLSWVMYRAYIHEDDPEMAAVEKAAFAEGLDEISSFYTATPTATPLVLGGGRRERALAERLRFPWE